MSTPKAGKTILFTAMAFMAVTGMTLVALFISEMVARAVFGPWSTDGVSIFESDDQLGFRLRPNTSQRHSVPDLHRPFAANYLVNTNSMGCFDSEYRGEQPNILILGDSMTFGWVPFEKSWGFLLERLTGIRTVKAAVPGIGPRYQLTRMRQLIPLVHPGVVLVGYFVGNDPMEDYLWEASPQGPPLTAYRGHLLDVKELDYCTGKVTAVDLAASKKKADAMLDRPDNLAARFKDYLRGLPRSLVLVRTLGCLKASLLISMGYELHPKGVLRYYHSIFRLYGSEPTPDWVRSGIELNVRNLTEMSLDARHNGAKFLVVLLPFPDFFQAQLDRYDPDDAPEQPPRGARPSIKDPVKCVPGRLSGHSLDRDLIVRKLKTLLNDREIEYLDLFTGMVNDGLSYEGEFHLSPKGHQLIADRIAADPRFKEWCSRLAATRR